MYRAIDFNVCLHALLHCCKLPYSAYHPPIVLHVNVRSLLSASVSISLAWKPVPSITNKDLQGVAHSAQLTAILVLNCEPEDMFILVAVSILNPHTIRVFRRVVIILSVTLIVLICHAVIAVSSANSLTQSRLVFCKQRHEVAATACGTKIGSKQYWLNVGGSRQACSCLDCV